MHTTHSFHPYLRHRKLGRLLVAPAAILLLSAWQCVYAKDDYVYKILPLGDSITQAEINRASYRYPLWKKLVDANIKFDFVGSMDNQYDGFSKGKTPQPDYKGLKFDKDHEGHFAWSTYDIVKGYATNDGRGSGNLAQWVKKYDFDIALVHLGTNDAFHRSKHDAVFQELKNLIEVLRSDNPNAVILLAKMIPAKRQPGDGKAVQDLNDSVIPKVAKELGTKSSPIIVVDHFSGFDAKSDTYDGVHPNESGEEKMAQRWFEAIKEALSMVKKTTG